MLDSLIKRLEAVSRYAVWASGGMLLFAAAMVTVDVTIRAIFGRSMGGSDEISGYLLAISTSWAFAYALLHRVNVRIDAAYLLLGRRLQAAPDLHAVHRALGTASEQVHRLLLGARPAPASRSRIRLRARWMRLMIVPTGTPMISAASA